MTERPAEGTGGPRDSKEGTYSDRQSLTTASRRPQLDHGLETDRRPEPPEDPGILEPDLWREWTAAATKSGHALTILKPFGVTVDAAILAGNVGLETIVTVGRLFTPVPYGRPAILLAVWADVGPLYETDPVLRDLIAFEPVSPGRWWYRLGDRINPALGAHNLHWPNGEPVRLYPHPLAWLQGSCEGAVLLDHQESAA